MKARRRTSLLQWLWSVSSGYVLQNALGILKFLPPFLHLFASLVGKVLGFVDHLVASFFGRFGRIVDLVSDFVSQITHGISPSLCFSKLMDRLTYAFSGGSSETKSRPTHRERQCPTLRDISFWSPPYFPPVRNALVSI